MRDLHKIMGDLQEEHTALLFRLERLGNLLQELEGEHPTLCLTQKPLAEMSASDRIKLSRDLIKFYDAICQPASPKPAPSQTDEPF